MMLKLLSRNADESRFTLDGRPGPASAPVCTNISPVFGTDNAEYLRPYCPLASDKPVIPQPAAKPSSSVWIRRFTAVIGFTFSGTNANLETTSSASFPSDGGVPPFSQRLKCTF